MSQSRQLAAIMFTDIVGYTALMGKDSDKALELVHISKEIQKPLVEKHNGKWLKEMGDGAMAQFGSALDAVNCAVAIQKSARAELDGKLRIGIHLGDVQVEENDVFGDGVNVASRLESIADPGAIYVSDAIQKAIQGQSDVQAKYLGEVKLKNVAYGVRTYAVQGVGLPVPEIKNEKELTGHFRAELQRRGVIRAGTTYLMLAIILVLLIPYIEPFLPGWITSALITVLVIGFPISMYFAWTYEHSPDGFVKTTSSQSWQNPYSVSQRKPMTSNFIISVLVLIIAGMYLYPRYFLSTEAASAKIPDEKSIAVLPLDIIGGDPEGEYFAAGVREEILNHLSLIDGLNVKSRSVVDRLGKGKTTQELVAELGLTHYLEGSTIKVDEQIRIIVQLIDAQTHDHIWSENYDRNYENLLATQSEIAKKIAKALQVTISPEAARVIDKQPTDNPQAWDDYLRAMYYWKRYTAIRKPDDLESMVRFLKASIEKDPDFALGYSRLAMAYQQVPFDPAIVFDFINSDSIMILCNRAIELDSSLSDPYLRQAEYYAYLAGDSIAAIRNYEEAISKGPHLPEAYWSFGWFHNVLRWDVASSLNLIFQGVQKQPESWMLASMLSYIAFDYLEIAEYEKAEYYYDKALVYDPDNIIILSNKSHLYKIMRQDDKVIATIKRVMEISPLNQGLLLLGMQYQLAGDYAESIKYFNEFYTKASETAGVHAMHQNHNYGYSLLKMGRVKEANEKFEIAKKAIKKGNLTPDYEYAKIFSAKGMLDSAYFHLERAVAGPIHWGMSDHLEKDAMFENIRDEPEFLRLVAIAKEKVRLKREEVHKLEESGVIPKSLDELELY